MKRSHCSICRSPDHNKRGCLVHQQRQAEQKSQSEQHKINGEKGGRPIEHRYFELFADLDDSPEDPGARESWVQNIVCVVLKETMQGRGNERLNDQVRKLAHTVQELTPRERIFKAERLIRKDSNRLKAKPKASGPTTQKALPSDGPVR